MAFEEEVGSLARAKPLLSVERTGGFWKLCSAASGGSCCDGVADDL